MIPTHDIMYAFLLRAYKQERFEGRNCNYCPDYSKRITNSKIESLKKYGYFIIPRNESVTGNPLFLTEEFKEYEGHL